jgi:hypothetical protein
MSTMKKPIELDPFEKYGREIIGMSEDERAEFEKFYEEFCNLRKEAGRHIDPETAEVAWAYISTDDPYDVVPEEYNSIFERDEYDPCVGRGYFARAPGSSVWVEFGDLPDAVAETLWNKHHKKLVFPAGLYDTTASFSNPIKPED